MIPFVFLSHVQGQFKCVQFYQHFPVPPANGTGIIYFLSFVKHPGNAVQMIQV